MQLSLAPPRLAFLGLGWIGRHRMQALAESGGCRIVALADPSAEALDGAAAVAPGARIGRDLDDLLACRPDGVVIATPSAQHAEQAIRALDAGVAVFCQKPLGRTGAEVARVVAAARRSDRLLGVDLSYRHTAALMALKDALPGIGRTYALDLTFHNAYGPDKPWFRDRRLSGGGCLIDLGVHLVDAALWLTGATGARCLTARLLSGGAPVAPDAVEDFALATLELDTGQIVRIACSWNLPAGQDAVIGIEAFGTEGGLAVKNLGGSFYDFECRRHRGTATEILTAPPDDWGGRAALDWAARLARGGGYDPQADDFVPLARTLDAIYEAGFLQAPQPTAAGSSHYR